MIDIMAKNILLKPCPDFIAQHRPRSVEKQLEHNEIRQVQLCVTLGMSLNFSKSQFLHLKKWYLEGCPFVKMKNQ